MHGECHGLLMTYHNLGLCRLHFEYYAHIEAPGTRKNLVNYKQTLIA